MQSGIPSHGIAEIEEIDPGKGDGNVGGGACCEHLPVGQFCLFTWSYGFRRSRVGVHLIRIHGSAIGKCIELIPAPRRAFDHVHGIGLALKAAARPLGDGLQLPQELRRLSRSARL